MLATVVGVVALIVLLDREHDVNEDLLVRIWMVSQLGLALLTGIVAWSESAGWPDGRRWLAQGIGVAALVAYAWYLNLQLDPQFKNLQVPRYLIWIMVAHLFVSVAPYLNQRSVADFWEYNRRLFANFVVGATFTLILYAGLSLAVLAVDQLFNLHISERIYARLFILLAGIFNTTYFLYHFPKSYEFDRDDASYNAVFRNLCKYILIPIVGLYFLILYAYGAKIIATWSLPRGWVGSLVIGFSVAGIFTYLLNFYLPEHDDSKAVSVYRKWFWWVVLPLTVLLFVAVGTRISDYGFTEPRFIVAQTGFWLALTCLYFLVSKSDNLKFIPISLGLIALTVSIGPLSAFSVARRSQEGIVKSILERNGRWENGSIKPGTTPMLKAEISQVESALQFLDRRGQLEVASWLPMPVDSFPAVDNIYDNSGRIIQWLGLASGTTEENNVLNISSGNDFSATDVRGFTQYFPLSLSGYRDRKPESGYYFESSEDRKKIVWQQVKDKKVTTVEAFDLQPVFRKWRSQTNTSYLDLPDEARTFDLIGAKGTLRIRVNDAQIEAENGDFRMQYLNGQLFLKPR